MQGAAVPAEAVPGSAELGAQARAAGLVRVRLVELAVRVVELVRVRVVELVRVRPVELVLVRAVGPAQVLVAARVLVPAQVLARRPRERGGARAHQWEQGWVRLAPREPRCRRPATAAEPPVAAGLRQQARRIPIGVLDPADLFA
ncbi:hypothetical protein LMTR13_10190 [Bradyrhizobium icense]|uniref:Uncharacterized protein n=1 Tax=Bradyrhizobium icense TaxID=1274631 RepID=A0A1B1UCH9_9BRAD|nr:hypothetical protein LMTR13_10190 [Bradyrhizobium icense]